MQSRSNRLPDLPGRTEARGRRPDPHRAGNGSPSSWGCRPEMRVRGLPHLSWPWPGPLRQPIDPCGHHGELPQGPRCYFPTSRWTGPGGGHHPPPPVSRSRPEAALTLAPLDPHSTWERHCEDAACEGFLWELRYAAPMGLQQLGLPVPPATLTGSQPSSHARRHGLASPVSSAMA